MLRRVISVVAVLGVACPVWLRQDHAFELTQTLGERRVAETSAGQGGVAARVGQGSGAEVSMAQGGVGEGQAVARAGDGEARVLARGRAVYGESCAWCHGRRLRGMPLWQVRDRYSERRAPALDGSGRAWTRSDAELFVAVRDGVYPGAVLSPFMPRFGGRLSDADIRASLAYVKAWWPIAMRVAQSALNPGHRLPARLPPGWRFPPDCGGGVAGVLGDGTPGGAR